MKIKKLKRICDVKGCKNKNTYSIAKRLGTGMTVIICEECLKEALEEINKLKNLDADKENKPEEKYVCDKCGEEFKSISGLKSHIKKKHTEE